MLRLSYGPTSDDQSRTKYTGVLLEVRPESWRSRSICDIILQTSHLDCPDGGLPHRSAGAERTENPMKKADRNSLLALPVIVLVGVGIAWAGSQGGATVAGIPVFALCVGLAFLIQWLAFIPAYLLQSEQFFDLTGSITYISVTAIAVLLSPVVDGRSTLAAGPGGDLGGPPGHLPVPPHPQGRQGRPL